LRVTNALCSRATSFNYYIPTFPVLVSACGDEFESLRKIFLPEKVGDVKEGDAWMVKRTNHERWYYGNTIEEAMSNLYLALHE